MADVMVVALLARDDAFERYVARVSASGQTHGPYFGSFDAVHQSVTQRLDTLYGHGLWEVRYEVHPWQFVAANEAALRSEPGTTVYVAKNESDGSWHGRIQGMPFLRESSFPELQRAAEMVHAAAQQATSLDYQPTEFGRLRND